MDRETLRRHYQRLEQEHAKFSAEEAARTRAEGERALRSFDIMNYMISFDNMD